MSHTFRSRRCCISYWSGEVLYDSKVTEVGSCRGGRKLGSRTRPSDLLDEDEIYVIRRSLLEWGGPAWCTEEYALAMGFETFERLCSNCVELSRKLESDEPLESVEWARSLLAAEVVFVSTVMGSGLDWRTTTGLSDEWTLKSIRKVQRKLSKIIVPITFSEIGTKPSML